jgi:hypothetical protein
MNVRFLPYSICYMTKWWYDQDGSCNSSGTLMGLTIYCSI